jgi:hypothetical protein
MTYLPPGDHDPYGQQPRPPQDPYGQPQPPPDPYGQQQLTPPDPYSNPYSQPEPNTQPNPYAQPNPYTQPTAPIPSSVPPTSPYGQGYGGYTIMAGPPQNTLALTSMILSLAGLLVLVTAPIGAILGHVALKQIRETGESGEGMAKTGIIIGWIITGLFVLAGLCCLGSIVYSWIFLGSVADPG